VTFGLMLYTNGKGTLRRLAQLKGVLLFAGATLLLGAIMVLKARLGWAEYSAVAFYPLVWIASSILGLAASRRPVLPLAVAAVGAWIGAVGGLLFYAVKSGLQWPIVQWYAETAARFGGTGAATYRAAGFDVDPNFYGLLGVVVLSFVLGTEGHRRARVTAAVGASLVIAMSGSLTAALATLLVLFAWATDLILNRKEARFRIRDSAGVLGAIVGVAVAVVIVAGMAGASQGIIGRLGQSAARVEGATSAYGVLNSLSSDRLMIWGRGLAIYAQQPMGWFMPAALLLGYSTHNEYISALIEGGPLYLAAYLAFMAWLAFRLPAAGARSAGLLLATCLASSALMLTPLGVGPMMCMGFYFIGWLSGQQMAQRDHADSRDT